MKITLSKIIITVTIFISLTFSANALKLEENNVYTGTIKDSNRNNIPLPPGEWLLQEINIVKPKGRGLSMFVEYTFYNSDVGYVFYFGPKGTKGSADMWVGRKTPSMCDGKPIAGKTNIRGINNTEWCVFEDSEYLEFRNYTAQNYSQYYHSYYIDKTLLRDKSKTALQSIGARIFDQVRKNKAGDISFLSNRLDFNKYSPTASTDISQNEQNDLSNLIKISKKDIDYLCDAFGGTYDSCNDDWGKDLKKDLLSMLGDNKNIMAVNKSRILDGPAYGTEYGYYNLERAKKDAIDSCESYNVQCVIVIQDNVVVNSILSKELVRLGINVTESKYKSLSNKDICIKATKLDGSGWMPSHSNDHVKEAWSRDLDIIQCRDLTGRKIAKKDTSNLKDKLMELKSLFDEGLITQDQYDKKSNEILETF